MYKVKIKIHHFKIENNQKKNGTHQNIPGFVSVIAIVIRPTRSQVHTEEQLNVEQETEAKSNKKQNKIKRTQRNIDTELGHSRYRNIVIFSLY